MNRFTPIFNVSQLSTTFSTFLNFSQLFSTFLSFSQLFSTFLNFSQLSQLFSSQTIAKIQGFGNVEKKVEKSATLQDENCLGQAIV